MPWAQRPQRAVCVCMCVCMYPPSRGTSHTSPRNQPCHIGGLPPLRESLEVGFEVNQGHTLFSVLFLRPGRRRPAVQHTNLPGTNSTLFGEHSNHLSTPLPPAFLLVPVRSPSHLIFVSDLVGLSHRGSRCRGGGVVWCVCVCVDGWCLLCVYLCLVEYLASPLLCSPSSASHPPPPRTNHRPLCPTIPSIKTGPATTQ